MKRFVKAASIAAVVLFMMVATASASIVYSTNSSGTIFVGGTDVLTSVGGLATLTFSPNPSGSSGVPSNVDYGDFLVACTLCGTQSSGLGTHFNGFTFDLVITDTTDNVQGEFVGTSTGGSIWSDVSQVSINWTPLQLGPGTSNVLAGLGTTFNSTIFTIPSSTLIVAPTSGCVSGTTGSGCGDTTVQGGVNSNAIPEPATFVLLGAGLLGLGALRRKRA